MAETGHGRILNVTAVDLGDELVADVAAGAMVLLVEDVADFDEDGGWLELNGEVVRYLTVDDDASTVSLASPLVNPASEFDLVRVWSSGDGSGRAVREWSADIVLDDQGDGDSVAAELDHALIDKLPEGVREVEGDSIVWERDGSDLVVKNVLGEIPRTDSDFIQTPFASGDLAGAQIISSGSSTWETIEFSEVDSADGLTFDAATRRWTITRTGVYLAVATGRWESNDQGVRGLRARFHFANGTSGVTVPTRTAAVAAILGIQNTTLQWFNKGDGISFEANQTSGANLSLYSGEEFGPGTNVTIVRLAT